MQSLTILYEMQVAIKVFVQVTIKFFMGKKTSRNIIVIYHYSVGKVAGRKHSEKQLCKFIARL